MGRMELNQNLTPELTVEMEVSLYAKFWEDRFQKCLEKDAPDLHVCRTRTIDHLDDPKEIERAREENQSFLECVQARLDEYVNWREVTTVVDVCCGPGHFLKWLIGKKIKFVHGIDVSAGAIDYMREHLTKNSEYRRTIHIMKAPAHHILKAPKRHAGFSPGSIDVVLLIRAGLHLPPAEWQEFCQGVQAVLKPGGLLVVAEFFKDRWVESRGQNEGTWYRYIGEYESALPLTKEAVLGPCEFDSDPCDIVFFRKPSATTR